MAKITDEEREQVHKLIEMAIDRSESGNTTFLEYSGLIGGLTIRLYDGPFEIGKDFEMFFLYFGEDYKYGESFEKMEAELCKYKTAG